MSQYENQHYVQEYILKKFSACKENKKSKMVNVVNVKSQSLESIKSDKLMTEKWLYNYNDSKEPKLEKKLNKKLETFIDNKIGNLLRSKKSYFEFSDDEINWMKKYILVQMYRNKNNLKYYLTPPKGLKQHLPKGWNENMSKSNLWRDEINYILENEWDELINSKIYPGVKENSKFIYESTLMIFKPFNEFVINDIGFALELGEIKFKYNPSPTQVENFFVLPFSPDLGIACVNKFWTTSEDKYISWRRSKILNNHKNIPIIDEEKNTLYKIMYLNKDETLWINLYMLNEAQEYLCYRSLEVIYEAVYGMVYMKHVRDPNLKVDYTKLFLKLENNKKRN